MSAREELASLPLHARIASVIRRAGLTQETFGLELGADRPRVNAWVKGRSGVSYEYAEKIAAFASRVYGETLPTDLFVTADRRTPVEVAAAQLAQTAQDLSVLAGELAPLLTQLRLLLERESPDQTAGGDP